VPGGNEISVIEVGGFRIEAGHALGQIQFDALSLLPGGCSVELRFHGVVGS
jgi:hypothetical protein